MCLSRCSGEIILKRPEESSVVKVGLAQAPLLWPCVKHLVFSTRGSDKPYHSLILPRKNYGRARSALQPITTVILPVTFSA